MRIFFYLSCCLVLASCSSNYSIIQVPANASTEIDFPDYEVYSAEISSKGLNTVDVRVLDKVNGQFVSGFGLGKSGKFNVMVKRSDKLVFVNTNGKAVAIKLLQQETQLKDLTSDDRSYVDFTLVNSSNQDIPLLIPTVMNPNLSPNSNSGVSLKIGQEILFKEKGKKYVLLVVTNAIKDGDRLDIPEILQKRRQELGLN